MENVINAEAAAIGAVILRPEVALDAGVSAADFSHPLHAEVWRTIEVLLADGSPLDPVIISDRAKSPLVTFEFVHDLMGRTTTAENVGHYGAQVRAAAIRREIHAACTALLASSSAGPALLSEAMERIGAVRVPETRVGRLLSRGLSDTIDAIETARAGGVVGGVLTGLRDLDKHMLGVQRGVITIVAGRPSDGKSSLTAAIARNAAKAGEIVDYYSLEDTERSLHKRWIAQEGQVDLQKLSTGRLNKLEHAEMSKAAERLFNGAGNILVHDDLPRNAEAVAMLMRRNARKRGTGLIVVDYVQKLEDPSRAARSRNDELTGISNLLCSVARQENAAMIVVSQLSRAGNEEPKLHHLRECGALEQDAHVALLLERPRPALRDSSGELPVTLCHIAKNKDGPLALVGLHWRPEYVLPGDMDDRLANRLDAIIEARQEGKKGDRKW